MVVRVQCSTACPMITAQNIALIVGIVLCSFDRWVGGGILIALAFWAQWNE